MIKTLVTMILGAAAWSMAGDAAEAGFAEGMTAYSRGDMKAALNELVPAARAGDSRAQYLLAHIYERISTTPKDKADAVMWYRRAAANGVVAAMRRLGAIYRSGDGTDSDPVQAYAWYDLASSRLGPHRGSFGQIRDDIAAELDERALIHARLLAVSWRRDAAKIGVMIPPPPPPVEPQPQVAKGATDSGENSDELTAPEMAQRVRRVQERLSAQGYDVGKVDGLMGPRTAAAIRAYQADQGLTADGRVTTELMERLEATTGEG